MRPVILDVEGAYLTSIEKEYLAHPLVAGVILFTRNFESITQLKQLVKAIRVAATRPVIIAVDHEGGRVQRFRDGFTHLPACGELLTKSKTFDEALSLAKASAFVMATELIDCDVDLSFAPVLDINGISDVIQGRSFSANPQEITKLASSYIEGMKSAGMASTGKHFPGHGSVKADSHIALPVDTRTEKEIFNNDMVPFIDLINADKLDAIMPSHVVYEQCDHLPCGFSHYWLHKVLKQTLGFKGAIISDDISMHGASFVGNHLSRAANAINAGCDFILACNDTPAAMNILDNLQVSNISSELLISTLMLDRTRPQIAKEKKPNWLSNKRYLDEFINRV